MQTLSAIAWYDDPVSAAYSAQGRPGTLVPGGALVTLPLLAKSPALGSAEPSPGKTFRLSCSWRHLIRHDPSSASLALGTLASDAPRQRSGWRSKHPWGVPPGGRLWERIGGVEQKRLPPEGKSAKRCLWQMKRADFEDGPRLSRPTGVRGGWADGGQKLSAAASADDD